MRFENQMSEAVFISSTGRKSSNIYMDEWYLTKMFSFIQRAIVN